jgi:hypothetical protein
MNINKDIEKEINQEFHKQIKELPEEIKDPVENTLEYIKKRAKCNDYEAAQIQLLMSEQSAQKTGYQYYTRYIAGQSTPEEDRADYYKSIRKSWNKFLDKYAGMTTEERVEALTVDSASVENIEKVLNKAHSEKLDYILDKTAPQLGQIDSLANELKSKSVGYLATHINYTKKKTEDLEKNVETYNKNIMVADREYDIQYPNAVNKDYYGSDGLVGGISEDTNYDPDAYNNVVGVVNELKKIGKKPTIINGYNIIGEKKEIGYDLKAGDIIQYKIKSKEPNYPIYKYFIVDRIDNNHIIDETGKGKDIATWKSRPLDLAPTNNKGEYIEVVEVNGAEDSSDDSKDIKLKDADKNSESMVSIKIRDTGFNYTDETDDPTKNIPYVIQFSPDDEYRLSNLYSVYDTDPTGLKIRLRDVKPRPSNRAIGSLIAGVCISGILVLIGALLMFGRAILSCLFSCFSKISNSCKDQSQFIKVIETDSAIVVEEKPRSPYAIPMFFSGVGLLTGGLSGVITSVIMLVDSLNERDEHNNQKKEIFQDIGKHNKFPFKSTAFGRDGWIKLEPKQYINQSDKSKDYYMSMCESGALIIPENIEEFIYDGRGSRYGRGITNQKDGTWRRPATKNEKSVLELALPKVKELKKIDKDKPFVHWEPIDKDTEEERFNKHPIEVGYGFNGAMTVVGLGKGGKRQGNQEDMFLKFQKIGELNSLTIDNIAVTFENRTKEQAEKEGRKTTTELTVRTKEKDKEWETV